MQKNVQYTFENGSLEIVAIEPPFLESRMEAAFVWGYKEGFCSIVHNTLSLITWDNSRVGRAGEEGYICGVRDARVFLEEAEISKKMGIGDCQSK